MKHYPRKMLSCLFMVSRLMRVSPGLVGLVQGLLDRSEGPVSWSVYHSHRNRVVNW